MKSHFPAHPAHQTRNDGVSELLSSVLSKQCENISLGLVHAQSVELITLVSYVSSCKT